MLTKLWKLALGAVAAAALSTGAVAAEKPKYGGTLVFVVASEAPSWDGHIETTFGTIHPIAPFYSLLVRVNPENPSDPTDIQCDVCESWSKSDDGLTYTFKIRHGITFHDGQKLTAADVVATYHKIIWPPKGIRSAYKDFYVMVDSVEQTDDFTVVFKLKYPSGAFFPALANPFNFIYSAQDLKEHGYEWHQTHINGTGPFMFKSYDPGSSVTGVKNPNYFHKGKPYLDGFKALIATKMSARVQAIESNRAMIEFRGFPPKQRDELKAALGDKITVQESDWNCVLIVTPNHRHPPFDNADARRALTLAIDRWGGSKYLSKIAIVKTVGGIVYPNHPLAAKPEELEKIAGYSHDIEKSRAEARALLKKAGVDLSKTYVFNNRGVDQPYKVVGTWLVDQWKKIGLNFEQQVNPSPVFYDILRKTHKFDASIDFNCQSVINPIADVSFFVPGSGSNWSGVKDDELVKMYDELSRAATFDEQPL